ncbi:MAG: nucleotidyltransferase family protein, partial [Oscillospiraceae bacterium]
MRIAGIICEYNPFHNGHAHQLAVLREAGYAPVCVMSGDYVQRGEPAVIPAAARAEAAVRCGAALVLELPPSYALRSAEGFADGGVELL